MLHYVRCNCGYQAQNQRTISLAIAAHNQLYKLVRLGEAAEAFQKNPPECTIDESEELTETESVIAHKYYSWAILACLDMLLKEGE
jgi:hypothetical protein